MTHLIYSPWVQVIPFKSSSFDLPQNRTGIRLSVCWHRVWATKFSPLSSTSSVQLAKEKFLLALYIFFLFWPFAYQFNGQLASTGQAQKQSAAKKSPTNVTNRTRGQCQRTQCTTDTDIYIYICEICMCELTIKPPNHGCRKLSASPECNNIVWCPEKSAKNKSKIKNKRMKKKKPTETYINYTDEICAVLFLWAVSRRQDSCFL